MPLCFLHSFETFLLSANFIIKKDEATWLLEAEDCAIKLALDNHSSTGEDAIPLAVNVVAGHQVQMILRSGRNAGMRREQSFLKFGIVRLQSIAESIIVINTFFKETTTTYASEGNGDAGPFSRRHVVSGCRDDGIDSRNGIGNGVQQSVTGCHVARHDGRIEFCTSQLQLFLANAKPSGLGSCC